MITSLLRIIRVFNSAEMLYLMIQGGPRYSSLALSLSAYIEAQKSLNSGYGLTIAVYGTLTMILFMTFYLEFTRKNRGRRAMKKRKSFFLSYLPLALLLVFITFPCAWTFLTSLKNTSELCIKTVYYLPEMPTLNSYRLLLTNADLTPSMLRSTLVATVTSRTTIIVSLMVGYAFSRYRFPGRDVTLGGTLLLYMFP